LCFFHFKVICISPTYELALQTGQVAEKRGKFCPEVKIGYAVRGEEGEKLEKGKICARWKGLYKRLNTAGIEFVLYRL